MIVAVAELEVDPDAVEAKGCGLRARDGQHPRDRGRALFPGRARLIRAALP